MDLYYIKPTLINRIETDESKLAAHRINILYMIQNAGAGHPGSALSSLEIVYYLYNYVLKDDDIFFSSKGHDCAALYSVLMSIGHIPESYIHNFRSVDGLSGHPCVSQPGIVCNTGSLGMGLSKAQGMSLAGNKNRIFVMLGDGELQEGQNIEAMRNIYKNKLNNIVALVDVNDYQCDYKVEETSPYYDIMATCYSLGWEVIYCSNGHDLDQISSIFNNLNPNKPNIVFFDTIKGKGLYKLEDTNDCHAGMIKKDIYEYTITILCQEIPNITSILMKNTKKERNSPEISNILTKQYEKIIENIMDNNEKVVVLNADLAKDCGLTIVKNKYPDRFFEFGISEQDMVSSAGGMAIYGKIPIVHSFSSFLCRRSNENVYNNATEGTKIIYIGFLSGLLPSGPGLSHTCVDDIQLMKTIPNMIVFKPRNKQELESCLIWSIYHNNNPVYISISCLPITEGVRL